MCSALSVETSYAKSLHRLFSPYEGHMVVLSWGVACLGAVDRYLGILEETMGQWDTSEAHFETAVALEDRISSPPLLARTCYWYARMLRARDDSGDRQRADGMLTRCTSIADELGMELLAAQADQLRA